MSYRIVRECLLMSCVIGGAIIGWQAGSSLGGQAAEIIGAFAGMGILGGLADQCMRS